MDSPNRHYLPQYGNEWVIAPNRQRFAERSVTFDNHWIGSAPCMPARRDIMTGRLNFLERGWGGYERVDVESEATRTQRVRQHLRKQYAATLTMRTPEFADAWFGKFLDELERQGGFDETVVVVTTDHGHLLGERGLTGKNNWHTWNELAHIPLMVHVPGGAHAGERGSQVTQNIDIMPTLLDVYGVGCLHTIHGESWVPMLEADVPAKRRAVLYGWFGQTVNVTDGRRTYFWAPVREDNQPLYRHFLTPGSFSVRDVSPLSFYQDAELGPFLPYTDYPAIRARVNKARSPDWQETMLYDLESDYGQTQDLAGTTMERAYEALLVETMEAMDAPPSQFRRLGLGSPSNG